MDNLEENYQNKEYLEDFERRSSVPIMSLNQQYEAKEYEKFLLNNNKEINLTPSIPNEFNSDKTINTRHSLVPILNLPITVTGNIIKDDIKNQKVQLSKLNFRPNSTKLIECGKKNPEKIISDSKPTNYFNFAHKFIHEENWKGDTIINRKNIINKHNFLIFKNNFKLNQNLAEIQNFKEKRCEGHKNLNKLHLNLVNTSNLNN